MIAWRRAIATACVRVSAWSFEITRLVSDLTVSTLSPIRRATSSVWKPSARSWRISRSRSDSGCSEPTPSCMSRAGESDGSTNALPSATVRIARRRSSGGEPFITYPRAPAAIASDKRRLSPYAEKITNFTPGALWLMRFTAETPSMPGSRTSISTTSGCSRSTASSASSPFVTSPTSSRSSRSPNSRSRPCRTTVWSSTTRQRVLSAMWQPSYVVTRPSTWCRHAYDPRGKSARPGKETDVRLDRCGYRRVRDRFGGSSPGDRACEGCGREGEPRERVPARRQPAAARGAHAGPGRRSVDGQRARGRRRHAEEVRRAGRRGGRGDGDVRTPGRPRRRDPRRGRGAERGPDHRRQQGHDRSQAFPARFRAEQGVAPRALLGDDHPDDLG